VALLNDCKYGYRVKNGVISLNLLRSPSSPDPEADRAEHEFTYALYPHQGDHVAAQVMRAGYDLNIPIRVVSPAISGKAAAAANADEWITVDAESVVVETIKPSEDDLAATVVRLYESVGARVKARVRFSAPISGAEIVSLIEEDPAAIAVTHNCIELEFGPFEIQTIRVRS
jgi:alpha-mannosidase